MDETDLNTLIKQLNLPSRFSFSELVDRVQIYASRDVVFVPWKFPVRVTGACIQSERTIYVFYLESGPPVHQMVVKLHELIHVVLGIVEKSGMPTLSRDEDSVVKETILKATKAYDITVEGFVMRSLKGREEEREQQIDSLALMLMHRLLPERFGPEKDLANLILD